MEITNKDFNHAELLAIGGLALSNIPQRIVEAERDDFTKFVGGLKVVPAKEATADKITLSTSAAFFTLVKSRRVLVKDGGVVYVVNSVLTTTDATGAQRLCIERTQKTWQGETYLAWK